MWDCAPGIGAWSIRICPFPSYSPSRPRYQRQGKPLILSVLKKNHLHHTQRFVHVYNSSSVSYVAICIIQVWYLVLAWTGMGHCEQVERVGSVLYSLTSPSKYLVGLFYHRGQILTKLPPIAVPLERRVCVGETKRNETEAAPTIITNLPISLNVNRASTATSCSFVSSSIV